MELVANVVFMVFSKPDNGLAAAEQALLNLAAAGTHPLAAELLRSIGHPDGAARRHAGMGDR